MAHILRRVAGAALFGALCLTGCSTADTTPQEGMSVTVNFGDVHRCSRISPEIVVYNPPKGTQYYEVRVTTADTPSRYLGGVRWDYGGLNEDGAQAIPEGALSNSYRGPCPPQGAVAGGYQYRFSVSAMSGSSSAPLAVSNYNLFLEE
ncbi:MAG: MbtF [Desulfovibrionaceae bacterium]|nr:MbtF [Desulfovibrionaceae bacterium]